MTEGSVQSQQKLSLFSEHPFPGRDPVKASLLQHVDSTLWVELYRRRNSTLPPFTRNVFLVIVIDGGDFDREKYMEFWKFSFFAKNGS